MSRGPFPPPASDEAKALGCTCYYVTYRNRRELVTNADCPLCGDGLRDELAQPARLPGGAH